MPHRISYLINTTNSIGTSCC